MHSNLLYSLRFPGKSEYLCGFIYPKGGVIRASNTTTTHPIKMFLKPVEMNNNDQYEEKNNLLCQLSIKDNSWDTKECINRGNINHCSFICHDDCRRDVIRFE